MGCFNSKLCSVGHVEESLAQQQEAQLSSPVPAPALSRELRVEPCLQGAKLYGVATSGDAALLFSRLIISRGHILAAVFEGHISPSAAEYCRSHCWDAFVQASASRQQTPAAAALRALDRGFLTSSKHSLESRLASGCSATLVHIDLSTRTVTVATVGAHGTVGLGSTAACADGSGGGDGRAAVAAGAANASTSAARLGRGHVTGTRGVGFPEPIASAGERSRELGVAGVPGQGLWSNSQRPLSRFVTLEAPSAECRRGLSGIVDLVQSALSPAAEAATGFSTTAVTASPPAPAVLPSVPEPSNAAGVSGGSAHGGTASFMRRIAGLAPGPGSSGPQVLGFGCAKDALLVAAFENAVVAAMGGAHPSSHMPHVQSTCGTNLGRFAALNRMHCGCDVRVSSRPLVAGDECLVLLAGCGGTGSRPIGAAISGRGSSGAGGALSPAAVATAAAAVAPTRSSNGGGAETSIAAATVSARSTNVSSGHVVSSSLSQLLNIRVPGGALSAADAVSLAHELAAADPTTPGAAAASSTMADFLQPTRDNRFDVLYDSYDSEAAAIATAAAAATVGESRDPASGAVAASFLQTSMTGDRTAMAVASYAVAAAVRNRVTSPAPQPLPQPQPQPVPSAACVTIWLDWSAAPLHLPATSAASGGHNKVTVAAPVGSQPPQAPQCQQLSKTSVRWEMLRCYCRFLIARRRRIIATWHVVVGAVGALQRPTPPTGKVASVLSLGGMFGFAAGGGPPGSVESCGGATTVVNRTASFTSRPPVMMEFVEELPTPAPSIRVPCAGSALPEITAEGVGTAMVMTSAATVSGVAMAAAGNAAAAILDASHSVSTAAPYGIAGLVMEPLVSSEELDEPTGGDGDRGGGSEGAGCDASAAPPWMYHAQRSFVMPAGSGPSQLSKELLGLRPSQSTPDLNKLAASPPPAQGASNLRHKGADAVAAITSAGTPMGHTSDQIAAAQEAAAYTHVSAYYSSQMSSSSYSASLATSAAAGHFDWSLVMASVNPNSGPRQDNSAGHTPIPSAAANRLSPFGFNPDGTAANSHGSGGVAIIGAGVQGAGFDPHAATTGGYLPIHGSAGSSSRTRNISSLAHSALSASPLSSGMAASQSSPSAAWTAAAGFGGANRPDGGGGGGGLVGAPHASPGFCYGDLHPPPGIVIGGRSVGDSADGDGDGGVEAELELISEDLPQLRIESTAELAALMAEIIITDDGEVVRTGGGAACAMPPPYCNRSHGLHGNHKGSRALSRQGSRGWQPRLAIVREDAREANTSTSCSQQLLAEGIRFTAISEERGSSQGSSGLGEHAQGSGSNASQQSRLANSSHGSASNGGTSNSTAPSTGSPNGSVEEQLAALGGVGTAATLVPPTLPPTVVVPYPPPGARVRATVGGSSPAGQAAGSQAPWSHVSNIAIAGHAGIAGDGGGGDGRSSSVVESPTSLARSPHVKENQSAAALSPSAPSPRAPLPQPTAPTQRYLQPTEYLHQSYVQVRDFSAAARAAETPRVQPPLFTAPDIAVAAQDAATAPVGSGSAGCEVGAPGGSLSFRRRRGAVAETASAMACSADNVEPALLPKQPLIAAAAADDDDGDGAADIDGRVMYNLCPSAQKQPHFDHDGLVEVNANANLNAAQRGAPPSSSSSQVAPGPILEKRRHAVSPLAGYSSTCPGNAVRCSGADGTYELHLPTQLQSRGAGAAAAVTAAAMAGSHDADAHPEAHRPLASFLGASSAATAATSATALESFNAAYAELESMLHLRPSLATVGRSRSASVSRSAVPSHQVHPHQHRNLIHHSSLPPHPKHRPDQPPGGASHDTNGAGEIHSQLAPSSSSSSPLRPSPLSATGRYQQATGFSPHLTGTHTRHHLYGLTECAAVRSCSSGASAVGNSPLAAGGAVMTSFDIGGAPTNTVTTLDRSWSVGSASGPLYSLLHSTLSKSSITAAISTAVPTPCCNSAQCSGGRLPTIHSFGGTNPPPSQASSPAVASSSTTSLVPAAVAVAGTGPGAGSATSSPLRSLHHSLSPSRQLEQLGGNVSSSGGCVLSINARAAGPAVAVTASLIGGSDDCAVVDGGSGAGTGSYCYHPGDDSPSFHGADVTGRPLPYMSQYTVQFTNYHQNRSQQALPPTRFSRSGYSAAEPAFGFSLVASGDPSAGVVVGSVAAGGVGQQQDPGSTIAAPMTTMPGMRIDTSPSSAMGARGAQSAALPRPLGSGFTATMYGAYGPVAGPSNTLPEVANTYDDGAATNRSSYISRSDASVWNSASAWTASTGRTTDMMGGSNRRVLASAGVGLAGGSSCYMMQLLPPGVALVGGACGGGDTSSLLAYNAAYSSVSGLLMTADAGAPTGGSNTQLLEHMGPGTLGAGGVTGGINAQQHSAQLSCSPRQMTSMFPGGGGPVGVAGGGDSHVWHAAPMMAALAAQVRAHQHQQPGPGGASHSQDAQQAAQQQQQQLLLQPFHHHQQLRQLGPYCGDEQGAVERPGSHHVVLQSARGLAASSSSPPTTNPNPHPNSISPQMQTARAHHLQHHHNHNHHNHHNHLVNQQHLVGGQDSGGPRRDLYERATGGLYDSGGQAQLIHGTIIDSASGCFLLGGGSTSNAQS